MRVTRDFSENDPIKIRFNQAVMDMKNDKNLGDYIKKKPWPRKYVRTHDVSNLYKLNIGENYRLIYTIRGSKDSKMYQLLDLLTHKDYDVLFGYAAS